MTPKEKAEELVDKFIQTNGNAFFAKECALIAFDEIIDAIDWHEYEVPNDQLKFWFEVKQEIEKL
jgi:hypothetical protein